MHITNNKLFDCINSQNSLIVLIHLYIIYRKSLLGYLYVNPEFKVRDVGRLACRKISKLQRYSVGNGSVPNVQTLNEDVFLPFLCCDE